MSEPIVMVVEEEMDEAQVVLIVHHLEGQGFQVQVDSLEPLVLILTCPPGIEHP